MFYVTRYLSLNHSCSDTFEKFIIRIGLRRQNNNIHVKSVIKYIRYYFVEYKIKFLKYISRSKEKYYIAAAKLKKERKLVN